MLKFIFDALDHYPNSYWYIILGPTLLLLGRILASVRSEARSPAGLSGHISAGDALILFVFLLAWRWPLLLVADDFNPDESQLIAGAITLAHDPVFWRSVDGTTSGPLNYYILLPLHWLGLPLDYFTARLTGLLLVWGALFACLQALARAHGRAIAWLGILPAAAFFATVTHSDLIHYSSEHLSLLLIAVPFLLLASRAPGELTRLRIACFVAGTAPWAKLHTTPLALVLISWAGWQMLREGNVPLKYRVRQVSGAVFFAITPTLLAAILIATTGQAETAIRRYFLHNLIYVSQDTGRTMLEALRDMKNMAMLDGRFPLLLITVLAMGFAALGYSLIRRIRPAALLAVSSVLLIAAALAVMMPRREFLHYVLLLPVPLSLWLGATAGPWWESLASVRSRWLLAGVLLVAGGLLPLLTRCYQPLPSISENFGYHWRHPRSNVAMVVQALTEKGGSLGVWGWANHLYVETGLRQATRDTHSTWSILPSAQREYHRTTYLSDLRLHAPTVFVDAVGPNAFCFEHRSVQAHEIFPELADYIRENYVLLRDVKDARIYVRKNNRALLDLSALQLDLLLARGREKNRSNTIPPTITPLDKLSRKNIGPRSVMMLLPPTAVEWRLDDDVREITVDFGFDPEAYERGVSNGAEVILELVSIAQTRQVYRRLLDPSHQQNDRGLQTARITLPPFSTGTHLVLRTDPGRFGDNAWDWVYLAGMQFRRYPHFLPDQFPGFNRVPDSADAESSSLQEESDGPGLQLHAPASLTYSLDGHERRLRLEYGFKSGAYTNGGHTDGAIFQVTLHRANRPGHELFERLLDPSRNNANRGPQRLDLPLPRIQNGDRLVISIDPGPAGSAAWDWTYIKRLELL